MQPNFLLVIGYGNRLRGDDGVGPMVAEIVASWQIAGVRALAVSQLAPELVEELKNADRVLFVDASAARLRDPFTMDIVEARESRRTLGHHSDAAHLLALTRELEGRCPEGWMLAIAVQSLDYGESLSETAQANVQAAVAWIHVWLREMGRSWLPCTSPEGS